VRISIRDILRPEYGLLTWPCSIVLADFLWEIRTELRGRVVLELGCGTALPGILAAKLGAQVTLTDLEADRSGGVIGVSPAGVEREELDLSSPTGEMNEHSSDHSAAAAAPAAELLENCRYCCQLNDVHCNVVQLRWGVVTPQMALLRTPDVLIAADVMFDVAVFECLLATVSYFLERNPHAFLLTTYQQRSSKWWLHWCEMLCRFDLRCEVIPSTDFVPLHRQTRLHGLTIDLLRVQKRCS